MKVAEALRLGALRLAAAGVPEAAGDARALMAHALGVARARVTLHLPDPLPEEAEKRFESAWAARSIRVPVSQILGYRDFYGRRFQVSADVLDPRPETEILVTAALELPFARVIDLGTGSGAILLSLLAECSDAEGVGTDLSAAALAIARENAATMDLQDRVKFQQADWWSGIDGRFDLVVSNPPYISQAEMAELSPELQYEPNVALTPGGDGLDAYRRLFAGLAIHMSPNGRALFEIGANQGTAVRALAVAAGFESTRLLQDFDGRDRVICIDLD
ncbi:MAG: peptide chain release factor N(5)-glutamine methyltransferase [Pseudomonadota bacterium]